MTVGSPTPLSEMERDALGELSNIAMARAANSLRQMVHQEVRLSVPSVEILSLEAATKVIARTGSSKLVAVRQDFRGAFAGRALLIFPEPGSLELVRAVVGKHLSVDDIADLEDESLAETGNIILNSWISTLANLLKRSLKISLPVVVKGRNDEIFAAPGNEETQVLFLHIQFEIRLHQIHGFVALMMDIPSVDELRSLIADYIVSEIYKHDPSRSKP